MSEVENQARPCRVEFTGVGGCATGRSVRDRPVAAPPELWHFAECARRPEMRKQGLRVVVPMEDLRVMGARACPCPGARTWAVRRGTEDVSRLPDAGYADSPARISSLVSGLAELLPHLRRLWGCLLAASDAAVALRPQAIVTVDYKVCGNRDSCTHRSVHALRCDCDGIDLRAMRHHLCPNSRPRSHTQLLSTPPVTDRISCVLPSLTGVQP